jgi:photosystem II stability/assembly factor-like uncharacterized protein
LLLLVAALLPWTEREAAGGESSVLAPLAARSLLLDAAVAGERVVAVGERGHVLLSDDAGAGWHQVVVPTRTTLTAVYFPTAKQGWAVGHDAVIIHTADGGESWELQYSAPDLESPLLDVWFRDERRGFAVGAYGLFVETADGGASWSSRLITDQDVHYNAIAAAPDGSLFLAGEMGSLFRSDDTGQSWVALDSPYHASFFGALARPDGGILVFGLRGHVYRSDDGGLTWIEAVTGTEASLMGGAALGGDQVVLGGVTGVLLRSNDGGRSFEAATRPDRKAIAGAVALPGEKAVLVGAFGAEPLDGPALERMMGSGAGEGGQSR